MSFGSQNETGMRVASGKILTVCDILLQSATNEWKVEIYIRLENIRKKGF